MRQHFVRTCPEIVLMNQIPFLELRSRYPHVITSPTVPFCNRAFLSWWPIQYFNSCGSWSQDGAVGKRIVKSSMKSISVPFSREGLERFDSQSSNVTRIWMLAIVPELKGRDQALKFFWIERWNTIIRDVHYWWWCLLNNSTSAVKSHWKSPHGDQENSAMSDEAPLSSASESFAQASRHLTPIPKSKELACIGLSRSPCG
jgi:hypothetical protein